MVLDDATESVVVDTDGDGFCDDLNPTLRPTTVPMSSTDALVLNMVPLEPRGGLDTRPEPGFSTPICNQGTGSEPPQSLCDTTANFAKVVRRELESGVTLTYNEAMYTFLHYAGLSDRQPAIWTVGPAVDDGVQCAGRQFDAFANNISDGWACLAVQATDGLGNMQVSRPLRVCIDHDSSGNDCPHLRITSVSAATPMVVTTNQAHGLTTGDRVHISGVSQQTGANNEWTVTVLGSNRLSLNGSEPLRDWSRPGSGGWLVDLEDVPDCTGTLVSPEPDPQVDGAQACSPWRLFPENAFRRF